MSPTRRDLFRRAAAATVMVAAAALPAMPVVAQTPGLASVIDTTDSMASGIGAIHVELCYHWHRWPQVTRERFLSVIDEQFPDLSAAAISLIERVERSEA